MFRRCSLRSVCGSDLNLNRMSVSVVSATKYQALENMMFSRDFCCRYFGSKFRWWKRQKESRSGVGQGVDVSSSEGQESGGSGLQRTAISVAGSAADTEDDDEDEARPLPDRLITELTAHRTLALRDAIASQPQVAMTMLLHKLCVDAFYQTHTPGCLEAGVRYVQLPVQAPDLKESASARSIADRHEAWKAD